MTTVKKSQPNISTSTIALKGLTLEEAKRRVIEQFRAMGVSIFHDDDEPPVGMAKSRIKLPRDEAFENVLRGDGQAWLGVLRTYVVSPHPELGHEVRSPKTKVMISTNLEQLRFELSSFQTALEHHNHRAAS